MSNISSNQRKIVRQLQQFTGAGFDYALEILQMYGWNLELAADTIFQNGMDDSEESDEEEAIDEAVLEKWFSNYEDSEQKDFMLVDGIVKFCQDIEVDPEDLVILVISEYMEAEHMLEYKKTEFITGMQKINAANIDELKGKINDLRNELDDSQRFREVYIYTYGFAKKKGQKSLALDLALAFWKLLLNKRFELLDAWCDFIEKNRKHAITKDEWTLLLEFATKVNGDLTKYEEDGAWPIVIDDFVVHMTKLQKESTS